MSFFLSNVICPLPKLHFLVVKAILMAEVWAAKISRFLTGRYLAAPQAIIDLVEIYPPGRQLVLTFTAVSPFQSLLGSALAQSGKCNCAIVIHSALTVLAKYCSYGKWFPLIAQALI